MLTQEGGTKTQAGNGSPGNEKGGGQQQPGNSRDDLSALR